MTTFMKQFNNQIHVGAAPRGSAKMDPYTKAVLTIDAVKQVEKTVKRKPGAQFAKDICNHIYGAPPIIVDMTLNQAAEAMKEYYAASQLDDLYLKKHLNESVNKEISRQFRKDGKRK